MSDVKKKSKKVEIVFEDSTQNPNEEDKKKEYFKNIQKELEKNNHYQQSFDKDLLLYENKKTGMNTYLSSFYINKHHGDHFHVDYRFRSIIGNIEYGSSHTDSIDQKEITVEILKNVILNIKKFKFCGKCNRHLYFVFKHINGEYKKTDELRECGCLHGENRVNGCNIVKDILEMKIEEETCSICLENIDSKYDACFFNRCEKPHYFHIGCLARVKSGSCPICKVHSHTVSYRNQRCELNCSDNHDNDDYYFSDGDEDN